MQTSAHTPLNFSSTNAYQVQTRHTERCGLQEVHRIQRLNPLSQRLILQFEEVRETYSRLVAECVKGQDYPRSPNKSPRLLRAAHISHYH